MYTVDELPSNIIERLLLILSTAFVVVNAAALTLQRPDSIGSSALTVIIWLLCAWGGHWWLNRHIPYRDVLLFPVVMFLSGWGLIIIDRLFPVFADRQTLWLLISMGALVFILNVPRVLHWLRAYRYLWLLFGLVLLLSTILLGSHPTGTANAPQLWLGLGEAFFQPSEALKIILVAFLASYLAEQYPLLRAEGVVSRGRLLDLSPRVFGPIILMWGLSVLVLIWQRDLGTAVIFFVVFLLLTYAASGITQILISGSLLIIIAGGVAYSVFGVVQTRVDIWLNPWPQAANDAYQIVQSLQAFAAGGIFGEGVGQGYPFFIPVAHSDFAFAALAEEWGFLGVVTVVACFAVIVLRGLTLATRHQGQPFYALLTVGLCALLGVQSVLIMGGVTRLLPLTGVTLPFVSYGGSSLLMSFIAVGLLLRLSAEEETPYALR